MDGSRNAMRRRRSCSSVERPRAAEKDEMGPGVDFGQDNITVDVYSTIEQAQRAEKDEQETRTKKIEDESAPVEYLSPEARHEHLLQTFHSTIKVPNMLEKYGIQIQPARARAREQRKQPKRPESKDRKLNQTRSSEKSVYGSQMGLSSLSATRSEPKTQVGSREWFKERSARLDKEICESKRRLEAIPPLPSLDAAAISSSMGLEELESLGQMHDSMKGLIKEFELSATKPVSESLHITASSSSSSIEETLIPCADLGLKDEDIERIATNGLAQLNMIDEELVKFKDATDLNKEA